MKSLQYRRRSTTHHSLVCELLDLLDGPWCPLLELHAEDALVEVDGVLASDDILDGATASLLVLCRHCDERCV